MHISEIRSIYVMLLWNLSLGMGKGFPWGIFLTTPHKRTFLIYSVGSSTQCHDWWVLCFSSSRSWQIPQKSALAPDRSFRVIKRHCWKLHCPKKIPIRGVHQPCLGQNYFTCPCNVTMLCAGHISWLRSYTFCWCNDGILIRRNEAQRSFLKGISLPENKLPMIQLAGCKEKWGSDA
jgi:hypothetical protein